MINAIKRWLHRRKIEALKAEADLVKQRIAHRRKTHGRRSHLFARLAQIRTQLLRYGA